MYFEVSTNGNSPVICNVPHSAVAIPEEFRTSFIIPQEELQKEAEYMADKYTDILYSELLHVSSVIKSNMSRIVLDIERFQNEKDEPMSKVGMSALYTRTSSGLALRTLSPEMKSVLERIYRDYHDSFTNLVDAVLVKNDRALIVDCHSFPSVPRIYEPDQTSNRPDICIGTDEYHTPQKMTDLLKNNFEELGFGVEINTPFSGSIVPTRHYKKDKRVLSVMVEVNRKSYMNEETFRKLDTFPKIGKVISRCIIKSLNQFLE